MIEPIPDLYQVSWLEPHIWGTHSLLIYVDQTANATLLNVLKVSIFCRHLASREGVALSQGKSLMLGKGCLLLTARTDLKETTYELVEACTGVSVAFCDNYI